MRPFSNTKNKKRLSAASSSNPPWYKRFVSIIIEIVKSIGDFRLLSNIRFLLIVIANFFFAIGFFVPYIFIPLRAKELEMTEFAWLFSIIGIVNIPSRILFGLLADRKLTKSINLNTICTLLVAVSLFIYLPLVSFWSQACFSVLFAVSSAGMNTLTTVYLVEIVGSANFNNGIGLLSFSRGIGCIIGPYVTGKDVWLVLILKVEARFLFIYLRFIVWENKVKSINVYFCWYMFKLELFIQCFG